MKVEINDSNNTLLINDWYEVDMDRADTADKILDWVHHLCSKEFVDMDGMRSIIEILCDRAGVKFRGVS